MAGNGTKAMPTIPADEGGRKLFIRWLDQERAYETRKSAELRHDQAKLKLDLAKEHRMSKSDLDFAEWLVEYGLETTSR